VEWIRLHYAYPTGFPEEVIGTDGQARENLQLPGYPNSAREQPGAICNEQGAPAPESLKILAAGISKLRSPMWPLRTTVITGFPGESEQAFRELMDFIKEWQF
jgi:ribosomal protein S12 methylthiotransferase